MNLKSLFYISIIFLLTACKQDQEIEKVFEVNFDQTKSIDKTGTTLFVPVVSTDIYVPMSSKPDWCTIGEKTNEGFSFTVLPNTFSTERTFEVVVAAVGFPFYKIAITQAAGDPQFSIGTGELVKTFSQSGSSLQVAIVGNVDYTVESSQEWCTVSEITMTGFKITAPANTGISQRTATLLIKPAGGFPNVTINVKQAGQAILLNGSFTNGSMNNWTTSGTNGLFSLATDQYIAPSSPTGAYYAKNNISATLGFEGRLIQKLTNIPDGNYTISCQVAGYPGNSPSTDGLYLIVINKSGVESQSKITLPNGGWKANSFSFSVTGGECSVGIYAKAAGGLTSTMSFKVMNFDLQ